MVPGPWIEEEEEVDRCRERRERGEGGADSGVYNNEQRKWHLS